jgi:hypothetical protein
MMWFVVDMRGLNAGQMRFVSDCLTEKGYVTVQDERTDFITIGLSDVEKIVVILTHSTDVRKSLASIFSSWCHQRSDLFATRSNYAWWSRILPCL